MAEIHFHLEKGGQALPPNTELLLTDWIREVIRQQGGECGTINYIFCGDDYLHEMNVAYLDHDTLTDIITFPMAEFPVVSGDLFISTERVADNAHTFGVAVVEEWHRVIIHGILHLCGQGDKTTAEAARMRVLEDQALATRPEALLITANS